MKKEFLQLAGVKDEASFYKKFPTEESFIAKYGKKIESMKKDSGIKKLFGGDLLKSATQMLGDKGGNPDLLKKASDMMTIGGGAGKGGGAGGGIMDMVGGAMGGGGGGGGIMDMVGGALGGGGGGGIMDKMGGAGDLVGLGGLNSIGNAVEGFKALKEEKNALGAARQDEIMSQLTLDAKMTDTSKQDIADKRVDDYVRPEDNIFSGEEYGPTQGVGTNILARRGIRMAEEGISLSNPDISPERTMRDYLAYMAEMEASKKYTRPESGVEYMPIEEPARKMMLGGVTDSAMSSWTKDSGGAQIGGAVGDAVGMIPGVGPVAKQIVKPVAQAIGHITMSMGNQNKTAKAAAAAERSQQHLSNIQMGEEFQEQNRSFLREGGNIGDQEELNVLWGGREEPLSYNPHAPGDGITRILKGQSHEEGVRNQKGIGLEYGGNIVEAENNEPIVKIPNEDGTGDSVSVMGILPLPKGYNKAVEELTGEKIKGNKFNTFTKNLTKIENKQTAMMEKDVEKAKRYDTPDKMDRISLATLGLNMEKVYNPKLRALQEAKEGLTLLQDSINQTAEEFGLDAASVARGEYTPIKSSMGSVNNPVAREGISFAKEGVKKDPPKKTRSKDSDGRYIYRKEKNAIADGFEKVTVDGKEVLRRKISDGVDEEYGTIPAIEGRTETRIIPGTPGVPDNYSGTEFEDPDVWAKWLLTPPGQDYLRGINGTEDREEIVEIDAVPEKNFYIPGVDPEYEYAALEDDDSGGDIRDYLNLIPSLFKNTDAEPFNNRQLLPELNALANNQEEPVDAQKLRPYLDTPFDVSYQDSLNRVTSGAKSAERLAAYNPGLLSGLKAEEYDASNEILGQQFRDNQNTRHQVYSGNRAILADVDLKNNAILSEQADKQSLGRSNTKATQQLAINSMHDKMAKHSLENKTLKAYENMYDYRFGKNYNAKYRGAPLDVDNLGGISPSMGGSRGSGGLEEGSEFITNSNNQIIGVRKIPKGSADTQEARHAAGGTNNYFGRNGAIIKSYKRY